MKRAPRPEYRIRTQGGRSIPAFFELEEDDEWYVSLPRLDRV